MIDQKHNFYPIAVFGSQQDHPIYYIQIKLLKQK